MNQERLLPCLQKPDVIELLFHWHAQPTAKSTMPLEIMRLHTVLSALSSVRIALAQNTSDMSWVPFDRNQFTTNATVVTAGDFRVFWKLGEEYSTYRVAS